LAQNYFLAPLRNLARHEARPSFRGGFSDHERIEFELSASDVLADLLRAKKTRIEAVPLHNPCNGSTAPEELSLLVILGRPEPLCVVRFQESCGSASP
jgi:hypothetical protein